MALPSFGGALEPADLEESDDRGQGDGPIFRDRAVELEHFNVNSGQQRMVSVAAANCTVLAGFQNGDVYRWFSAEDETSQIDFGRDKCTDVTHIFLEPSGFHALITSGAGDTWYLNFQSPQARVLPKLKGHLVEAVSWDPDSTATSTRDVIIGTMGGQLLQVVIESKERVVKTLFSFDLGEQGRVPISAVHRETKMPYETAVEVGERVVLFVAAGCGVYAFIGSSIETLFQRYQGDGAAARALVYEVPRDSPHGELHVDSACIGSPSTKVLFWLTGVGVLAANIRNPLEADNAVLESPPGLIPFPPSPKAATVNRGGGSLIASLLPPTPPPPPLSMALTKYHVIFIFEDRWAVVSRISHEVVQQQEWASPTYGGLKALAKDIVQEQVWMCSEKHMFEIVPEAEDRNVWSLLLRLEQFEDALENCRHNKRHRSRVLAAHADWLFRQGELVESARKFAEAVSVPFEHVALRFLQVDQKAALLEYFYCRMHTCSKDDKVTRALLGVWAVEIALANLNNLRLVAQEGKTGSQAALEEARNKLRKLLAECRDLDVHATIYHLLQSHDWLEELAIFAEGRGDYDTVILHHVSRCEYASAIQKLKDFQASGAHGALVCRFAPVLFGAEPHDFVSLLLRRELERLDPLSVLPALYTPRASALHRSEALRYLEHVLRHHPGLVGNSSGDGEAWTRERATSVLLENDLISGVAEDGTPAPTGRSWATGTAVLNAMVVLYAGGGDSSSVVSGAADSGAAVTVDSANGTAGDAATGADAGSAEETLLRFFAAQEGNPLFDPQFALRICVEQKLMRAVVLLYGLMGMHEEAVDAALERGDVTLAKHNACKPADRPLRQKLWLRIVEHQAAAGDVQAITCLIRESQELTVRDVLPYMHDSITIDAFQAEICECLDSYEGQILTLRQEMDDHRRALSAFKEDLKQAEERCVTIREDQVCEICSAPAIRERFYVFACRHCFHEACLRALVVPTLPQERRDRLFSLEAIRVEYQAAAAGLPPLSGSNAPAGGTGSGGEPSLAEVEDELDGILADDCPLCGRLMINTIRRPFIDLPTEQAEVDSWAII